MLWRAYHAKQLMAISGPSGRVNDASARLVDAASSPRRLCRHVVSRTTARTMKKVNCRVSNPPPDVQTANVALLHTRPSDIHVTSRRCWRLGKRAIHHAIAARVAAVKATESHGAASSGGIPNARHMAASSIVHRKLEYPSTRSPTLYTRPCPSMRLCAYRKLMKASSVRNHDMAASQPSTTSHGAHARMSGMGVLRRADRTDPTDSMAILPGTSGLLLGCRGGRARCLPDDSLRRL